MRGGWLLGVLFWGCGVATPLPSGPSDPIPRPSPLGRTLCESMVDCGEGERCVAGICEVPLDAPDVGSFADASGAPDAELPLDGSIPDATAADVEGGDLALPADAGTKDLGQTSPDSGPFDAGILDSGILDSGTPAPQFVFDGLSLVNLEQPDDQRFLIPAGTSLGAGESLVLVRSAERNELEVAVGPLPSAVQVISTGATSVGAPIINGGESFQLEDGAGQVMDGPTPVGQVGGGYQRTGPGAGDFQPVIDPVPGTSPGLPPHPTPRIVAWSDRTGTGQFRFEWVELRYDP
ncbi:MAG: hypothetical protein IPG45_33155 [Deltaproteobacteria bacterium]|nr:hypothetical protein [Deltaproteobacteria bacterium]